MTRVIMNAGQSFDDRGHTRQGPEIRAVSVGPGALAQSPLDVSALGGAQLWLPSGSAGASQGNSPASLPLFVPSTNALPTHLKSPSNGSQDQLTRRKQPSGVSTPFLQGFEISPGMIWIRHAISILLFFRNVTILCEAH